MPETCCICGIALPNRYAVAGNCEGGDCSASFCQLCWNRSNHRCRNCGYEEAAGSNPAEPQVESEIDPNPTDGLQQSEPQSEFQTPVRSRGLIQRIIHWWKMAKSKKLMHEMLTSVKKLGGGASELLSRLSQAKSPDEMLAEIDRSVTENNARLKQIAPQEEVLYRDICKNKKAYTEAPAARRDMLASTLNRQIQEHKGLKRRIGILEQNVLTLKTVRTKFEELIDSRTLGLDEDAVEDLINDFEDEAAERDDVMASFKDLAGREISPGESVGPDFLSELDAYGMDEPAADPGLASALDAYGDPEPEPPAPEEESDEPNKSSNPETETP